MEMFTADCNLFFCTSVHEHMCMQAFVALPSIEGNTGITPPPLKKKRESVVRTQMFTSV